MALPTDDLDPETPRGDLVTWMAPGALKLGSAGVVTALIGAFALGVVTALAMLAVGRDTPRKRPTFH